MSLFNLKDVTLHSGSKSDWIIDCDALTDEDLAALARLGSRMVPPFAMVEGIPRGGLRFAEAMKQYINPAHSDRILICDDVLTTGNSFKDHAKVLRSQGVPHARIDGLAIFQRGTWRPDWVQAIIFMAYP